MDHELPSAITESTFLLVDFVFFARLHKSRRCPYYRIDYGGSEHRWCASGAHLENARIFRGLREGSQHAGYRLRGCIQTLITDFYKKFHDTEPG